MSLADRLKHLVVEEDPTPTPPVKVTVVAAPEATMTFNGSAIAGGYAPAATFVPSPVADGFLAKLNQKIALPGAAEKFEKTLASLSTVLDESMRLTAALNVLKDGFGIDTQALLADYSIRRQRLDQEVSQFATSITAQRKQDLDDRQAQLGVIETQIQQLQSQRTTLFNAITEATGRLNQSQAGFDGAVQSVRMKIESAIARLKGGA